jgi:hypothetical protein
MMFAPVSTVARLLGVVAIVTMSVLPLSEAPAATASDAALELGTATPTSTPSPTDAGATTGTPTPTTTLPPVHIAVSSPIASAGDSVEVVVSLITSGREVAATANDILFDTAALSVDPASCQINPTIGKRLVASLPPMPGTLRIFIQGETNVNPIPDGPLCSCTFAVAPSAALGLHVLQVARPIAVNPDGAELPVLGDDGSVEVVVPPPTATPTPTVTATEIPTSSPTASATANPCPSDCNGSGSVTIEDITVLVDTALGNAGDTVCGDADRNRDGAIRVDEILAAINLAIIGCPL